MLHKAEGERELDDNSLFGLKEALCVNPSFKTFASNLHVLYLKILEIVLVE